jgi:hypothetical protein
MLTINLAEKLWQRAVVSRHSLGMRASRTVRTIAQVMVWSACNLTAGRIHMGTCSILNCTTTRPNTRASGSVHMLSRLPNQPPASVSLAYAMPNGSPAASQPFSPRICVSSQSCATAAIPCLQSRLVSGAAPSLQRSLSAASEQLVDVLQLLHAPWHVGLSQSKSHKPMGCRRGARHVARLCARGHLHDCVASQSTRATVQHTRSPHAANKQRGIAVLFHKQRKPQSQRRRGAPSRCGQSASSARAPLRQSCSSGPRAR